MATRQLLALAALTLIAAGCAQPSHALGGVPVPQLAGAAPVDARLVTPDFGWVLTPDRLLVSHDRGVTFTDAAVPLPAGTVRSAYFGDADNGLVASVTDDAVTLARTTDGGRHWRTSTVRDPKGQPAGYSALGVSFGNSRSGAMVARIATSTAFSVATLFTTADGGESWSAVPAPEAGQVTVDSTGRTWLAGDALNFTDDRGAHWTRAQLDLAGTPELATVAPPVDARLPVTVVRNGQSEVEVLSTDDGGRTWGHPVRLPLTARTGPGVRIPVADNGSGLVVVDSRAGHAYQVDGGRDLRPAGLPEGTWSVSFGGVGTGWALATHGACTHGKQDCALHHELAVTDDAGSDWRTVAEWTQPVR